MNKYTRTRKHGARAECSCFISTKRTDLPSISFIQGDFARKTNGLLLIVDVFFLPRNYHLPILLTLPLNSDGLMSIIFSRRRKFTYLGRLMNVDQ